MESIATTLIEAAVHAPSIHNTQPWRFRVRGDVIDVIADRSRAVPAVDPTGRELVVSCGAALEHLLVAARALGRAPVARLLPDGTDADLLASVDVSARGEPTSADRALYDAIPLRRTARAAFENRRIDSRTSAALTSAVEPTGAWVGLLSRDDDVLVTSILLGHADAEERDNPAYLAELGAWRKDDADDGIPTTAVATPTGRRTSLTLRDFDAAEGGAAHGGAAERDPSTIPDEYAALAVIGTPADETRDWVAAGRATALFWLRATTLGLVASPLTQVVDSDAYRDMLRRALRYQGFPQMVLRVGYGSTPPPTPRRSVTDVTTTT